ncbi:flavodoxin family protein [[Clostridium] fimetarium]|uniref:Flavodoxin n=1 Tax=[Clostridium] fimetarium TaxID=99656 RepID=A0A1I0PVB1_9FIRM|nr:flavodoxin domain-containing protein [[Clostridium] fimetarium]SEW18430.1 Flavodoxin [[Clostridium] fimetarium]
MNIGIIVHSHTGNTLSVAEKIKEKFIAEGHLVTLEQVIAVNEDPGAAANVELKTIPDITGYDMIIFGAPVRAFSLSPVMLLYLNQLSSLQGKKISCFVTQQLPFTWLGGNRSIKQMKKAVIAKKGTVNETGVVNWSSKNREDLITDFINKLAK